MQNLSYYDAYDVLALLDPKDLPNACLTNKTFAVICADPVQRETLFQTYCRRSFDKTIIQKAKTDDISWEVFYKKVHKLIRTMKDASEEDRDRYQKDMYAAGDAVDIHLWIHVFNPLEYNDIMQIVEADNADGMNYLFNKGYMIPFAGGQEPVDDYVVPGEFDQEDYFIDTISVCSLNVLRVFVKHGFVPEYRNLSDTIRLNTYANVTWLRDCMNAMPKLTADECGLLMYKAIDKNNTEIEDYLRSYINIHF